MKSLGRSDINALGRAVYRFVPRDVNDAHRCDSRERDTNNEKHGNNGKNNAMRQ